MHTANERRRYDVTSSLISWAHSQTDPGNLVTLRGSSVPPIIEVIRQHDSSNTGELDRHAQHQQPCLASRTLRVVVRQEQPVLSGTHWSSFAHRQMSVVLCLWRFAMKIEKWHIRTAYDTRGRHKDTRGHHASNTCTPLDGHACLKAMCFYWLWDGPLFKSVVTDKTVSWDWGGCFIICTILAVTTATVAIHIYFAFYWDILMLREANWSRGICKKLLIFRPLKNIWWSFWFPAWSHEQLCTNQTRCWLFHGLKATTRIFFFQSLPPLNCPFKQTQWCGNLTTGLQSMTV